MTLSLRCLLNEPGWRVPGGRWIEMVIILTFAISANNLDCIDENLIVWSQKYVKNVFLARKSVMILHNFFLSKFNQKCGTFYKKCGNAGKTSKCGISRTITGWLTPMQSRCGNKNILISCTWLPAAVCRIPSQFGFAANWKMSSWLAAAFSDWFGVSMMFDTSCPSRDDRRLNEYSMLFPNKLNTHV